MMQYYLLALDEFCLVKCQLLFENYFWDHSADNTVDLGFNQLFSLIKKYSREIHVFTTNFDNL